jgi:PEP-CTERM motif
MFPQPSDRARAVGLLRQPWLLILAVVLFLPNVSLGTTLLVRDAPGGEDYAGNAPGNYLTGTGGGLYGTVTGGAFTGLAVGTYDLQADDGSGYQPLRSYCLEPTQFMMIGTQPTIMFGQPYSTAALTSLAGISAADQTYLETLWSNAFVMSQTSQNNAAAFQALIWEAVRDTTYNLTQGNFRLDASSNATVIALANSWNANIVNHVWTSSTPLEALVSPKSQDILRPVPEPATIVLLAIGVAVASCMQFRLRRRR